MLPKERMLEMFLSAGKMRSNPAMLDFTKLESFDRKYKAKKGIWRTNERLVDQFGAAANPNKLA